MKRSRLNGFTRIAGSTYACECCGRQTRNTGAQALGSKTCTQCWELAGIENSLRDGHLTADEARPAVGRYVAAIEAKGGRPREAFAWLLDQMACACGNVLSLTTAEQVVADERPTGNEVPVWACHGCEFIEEAR